MSAIAILRHGSLIEEKEEAIARKAAGVYSTLLALGNEGERAGFAFFDDDTLALPSSCRSSHRRALGLIGDGFAEN